MGALRTSSGVVVIAAALFSTTGSAFAHGNEDHGAALQPAAPAAIPAIDEPVTGGGAADGTPANGAQPAPPTDTLPPIARDSVSDAAAAAVKPTVVAPAMDEPATADLESISEPATTTVPNIASGGGGAREAGASAVPANAPVVTGAGELPFTGIEETILLIALAGMLVPIGVLLYCGARRGDRTRFLRHLAAPRFQWSPAPGVRPEARRWPDVRA